GTLTYASATKLSPNDGAYAQVRYGGCGSTAPYQVDLYSCAADGVGAGTATPGCIGVVFNALGIMGGFLDTDGRSCTMSTGSASFHVPAPDFTSSPPAGSPPPAASGSFLLNCVRDDGTQLELQGRFVIPVASSFL